MDKCIIVFWESAIPECGIPPPFQDKASVLVSIRPLASAWLALIDGGLEDDLEMVVKGNEVLSLIQHMLVILLS